jgi:ethanolamine utilization microcompartment shell protein EutS
MSCNLLTPKDPDEKVILTFDFGPALATGDGIVSIEPFDLSVIAGDITAAMPSLGTSLITTDGQSVQVPVEGGVDTINYGIKATVLTLKGLRLVVSANLPVRTQ